MGADLRLLGSGSMVLGGLVFSAPGFGLWLIWNGSENGQFGSPGTPFGSFWVAPLEREGRMARGSEDHGKLISEDEWARR